MVRYKQMALLVGAVGWLWLIGPAAPTARAAPLIPRLVSVVPEGGNFRWTYTASIATNERVQSGMNSDMPDRADFFTLYDLLGLVAGMEMAPAGWTVSVQNVGVTAAFALPPTGDSPVIPNVTFTYTGAAPIVGPNPAIGVFSYVSVFGAVNENGSFTAETTFNDPGPPPGPQNNMNVYTSGPVAVPVPEPGTMVLAVAGPLFVFGAVRRGLRRRPG